MMRQKLSADHSDTRSFEGTKLVLLIGEKLAVIRRDDIPDIPYPGCLDLPGGQREPGETPQACVLREVKEELGLSLSQNDLINPRFYTHPSRAWFFAARLPANTANDIVFGDEGQEWALIDPMCFIAAPDAVPHFRKRVRTILELGPG